MQLSRFHPLKGPPWQRQTACKPGSVPLSGFPKGGDGHSSGAPVAERLVRPTRAAARRPARHLGSLRDACRSYLVLLPVGFSLPPPLPAARCALTAPFQPCRPPGMPETGWRCTFCGTFPGVAPAGRYPAPYLRGARTFLFPRKRKKRPSDRLAPGDLGCRGASVKGSSGGFRISKEAVQANPARRPAAKVLSSGVGRKAPARSAVSITAVLLSPPVRRRRRAIQPGRARPSPTAGSWNTATSPACLSGHASPG